MVKLLFSSIFAGEKGAVRKGNRETHLHLKQRETTPIDAKHGSF